MVQRQRDDDGDVRVQPAPAPPSFPSLPDHAHSCIASFLPDGNKGNDSRLRVSEASCALLNTYGDRLNRMHLGYVAESSTGRLAALLRRNNKLAEVTARQQDAIPALCLAIVQGCCRGVKRIDLVQGETVMTQTHLNLLAGALEVDGALAGLRIFQKMTLQASRGMCLRPRRH